MKLSKTLGLCSLGAALGLGIVASSLLQGYGDYARRNRFSKETEQTVVIDSNYYSVTHTFSEDRDLIVKHQNNAYEIQHFGKDNTLETILDKDGNTIVDTYVSTDKYGLSAPTKEYPNIPKEIQNTYDKVMKEYFKNN